MPCFLKNAAIGFNSSVNTRGATFRPNGRALN